MPPSSEKHFTREPWWVILLSTAVTGLLALWQYDDSVQATLDLSMPAFMGMFAALGAVASTILVLRSHIRSPFWSNCALIVGMIVAALGASVLCLLIR